MNEQKLQSIRDAEKKAKELFSSVEEETQTIIRNAHLDVQKIMEDTKGSIRVSTDKLMNEYRAKGDQEAQKILSGLESDCQKLAASATEREAEAIEFLNNKMKVSYGNR